MDILASIQRISIIYGKEMAVKVEALFRNETAHFKSGNFKICFSPGMEATKETYPYGWTSLKSYWDLHPEHAPIGLYKQVENSSRMMASRGERTFIKFPNLDAAMITVAERLKAKGGNTGAWASNNIESQKKYSDYLLRINTPYANSIK